MNRYIIEDLSVIVRHDWKLKSELKYLDNLKKYIGLQKKLIQLKAKESNFSSRIRKLRLEKINCQNKYKEVWIERTKLWHGGFCYKSISGFHTERAWEACEYCGFDPEDVENNYQDDDYYYDTYIGNDR